MKIKLFNTISDTRKLEKTLTNEKEIQGVFKNAELEQTPRLYITGLDPTIYNYVFIETLNKYYFIVQKEYINNNRFVLYLKIDLLMTYKEQIKLIKATKVKGATGNNYLIGNNFPVEVKEEVEKIPFPNKPFKKNGSKLLTTISGTWYSETPRPNNPIEK